VIAHPGAPYLAGYHLWYSRQAEDVMARVVPPRLVDIHQTKDGPVDVTLCGGGTSSKLSWPDQVFVGISTGYLGSRPAVAAPSIAVDPTVLWDLHREGLSANSCADILLATRAESYHAGFLAGVAAVVGPSKEQP
jgi:hypothetical protein